MSAIENFLQALRRNNAPNARKALGMTVAPSMPHNRGESVPPANQAYNAIATALKVEQMPDGAIRTTIEAPTLFMPGMVEYAPYTQPTELSPEYHAGLASRMIERLDADARRLADAIAAERKQHKLTMTALYAELAGLKKVRRAYKVAGAVLQPVEPVAAVEAQRPAPVDPARMTAVGERIAETVTLALKPRRRRKPAARVDSGASGAVDMG